MQSGSIAISVSYYGIDRRFVLSAALSIATISRGKTKVPHTLEATVERTLSKMKKKHVLYCPSKNKTQPDQYSRF